MNRRSFITKVIGALVALVAGIPFVGPRFRARFAHASKPLHPEFGIAIQHKKQPTFSLKVRHTPLPCYYPAEQWLHEWQWQWDDGTPESPIFTKWDDVERYGNKRFGDESWKPVIPNFEGTTWDEIKNNLAKA